MTTLRYVNDLGNGHSGYIDYGSINVSTASGAFINTKQGGDAGSDAFGRLRTSSPLTIFDSQQRYSQDNAWTTATPTTNNTDVLFSFEWAEVL